MPKPLADRLWSKVEKMDDGCWIFTGYRHPTRGYGQIGLGSREAGIGETHRVAYELSHGPIPAGAVVRHTCDVPACINPEHLLLGSHQDNANDKVDRGRQARGAMLPHTKLTDHQVQEIKQKYIPRTGPTRRGGRRSNASELAEEYGISRNYVMQLVHGWYRKEQS